MSSLQRALQEAGHGTNAVEIPATSHNPLRIDARTSGISLRFALVEKTDIAAALWHETACKKAEHQTQREGGLKIIAARPKVGLLQFVDQAKKDHGFRLRRVVLKEWQDRVTHLPRFAALFILGLGEPDPAMRDLVEKFGVPSLLGLCTLSCWTVEAYRNSLDDGAYGFSINAMKRKRTDPEARLHIDKGIISLR